MLILNINEEDCEVDVPEDLSLLWVLRDVRHSPVRRLHGACRRSADSILQIHIDFSFLTSSSVLFDAVYIPGGDRSAHALQKEEYAVGFVKEAYTHCKTIAATGAGGRLLRTACVGRDGSDHEGDRNTKDEGLIIGREGDSHGVVSKFINAMARHRHWERELMAQPA